MLYWEGSVAGSHTHPAGMQVALAKQLLQYSPVCWDKTKINLTFQLLTLSVIISDFQGDAEGREIK